MDKVEEWINELEDKATELTRQSSKMKKNEIKSEDILLDLWNNTKWNNICLIGIIFPDGE